MARISHVKRCEAKCGEYRDNDCGVPDSLGGPAQRGPPEGRPPRTHRLLVQPRVRCNNSRRQVLPCRTAPALTHRVGNTGTEKTTSCLRRPCDQSARRQHSLTSEAAAQRLQIRWTRVMYELSCTCSKDAYPMLGQDVLRQSQPAVAGAHASMATDAAQRRQSKRQRSDAVQTRQR